MCIRDSIIIPMVTGIMGGSLVVESIFSVPGMGGMMVNSIKMCIRDSCTHCVV